MRVLFVNTLYFPYHQGGAEISVQHMCESLAGAGHEIHVATLSPPGRPERSEMVNNVQVHYLKCTNFYWPLSKPPSKLHKILFFALELFNPFMGIKVLKIIKKYRPEIIHTNNIYGFSPAVWITAALSRVKIIHTLRDYYLTCTNGKMYRDQRCKQQCKTCRFYSSFKSIQARRVDCAVGISNFILNRHKELNFFKNSETAIIHNAQPSQNLDDIEPRVGKKIGFIGRVSKEKGVELLLKEFSSLENGYQLLVAGEIDADVKDLVKLHTKSDRITFAGKMKPADFYSKVDLVVIPSLWEEPFGRAVIEAYSYGLPVIASSRGGLTELVGPDTGLIFDPDMPGMLASSIQTALAKRYSREDILHVSAKFSKENQLRKLLSLYKKIRQGAM